MPNLDVFLALKPFFTTPEGKRFRESVGFPATGGLVVTCRPDERVTDVWERVHQGDPPVLVAFLEKEQLRVLAVRPERLAQPQAQPQEYGYRTTISMLYWATRETGEKHFRLGAWDVDQVATTPDAQLADA